MVCVNAPAAGFPVSPHLPRSEGGFINYILVNDAPTLAWVANLAAIGSKGLQLYVPLHTPVTYDLTKPFAKTIAELLEREHRDLVVSEMAKA